LFAPIIPTAARQSRPIPSSPLRSRKKAFDLIVRFGIMHAILDALRTHALMPKLQIQSGVLEGKVYDLIEERITMGRALDNMIRLEDGTVSHHHAMLLMEGTEYKLRDLNSTNGTRVNGMRIVETKLHHGDQVRLGSVEMRFESDIKKSSQPLPPTQTGVDIAQVGTGSAPPPTFGSASPFGRRKANKPNPLLWGVLGLGLVAVIVVGWFFVKFVSLK
jgi:hypothetical protein